MKEQCCEKVWQGYRWGKCTRTATVEHDGLWYCWQHAPEYVAKKKLEELKALEASNAARDERDKHHWAEQAAREAALEKAETWRALLDEWLNSEVGRGTFYPEPDLVARTRAALNIPTGEKLG